MPRHTVFEVGIALTDARHQTVPLLKLRDPAWWARLGGTVVGRTDRVLVVSVPFSADPRVGECTLRDVERALERDTSVRPDHDHLCDTVYRVTVVENGAVVFCDDARYKVGAAPPWPVPEVKPEVKPVTMRVLENRRRP